MSNLFTNGKGPSVFFLMTNPDDIYGNMIGKPHSKFSYRFFGGGKKPNREERERERGFKLVSMFCLTRRHWDTSVTGLLREPVLRHTHGRLKSIQDLILASSSSTHLNSIFAIASFSI